MDTQMLMLYILILINQVIAYGALVYLALKGHAEDGVKIKKISQNPNKSDAKKQDIQAESLENKGKYLDYINKFEVEA